MSDPECIFCGIVSGSVAADVVYQDSEVIAFLDKSPLFPGHVLLCPKEHYPTLTDLPLSLINPVMRMTQLLAGAVERALDAGGTFIAINNRVSQTVPHLHIHVVPRRKRDGLKGFFWPRHDYENQQAREAVRDVLQIEIRRLLI